MLNLSSNIKYFTKKLKTNYNTFVRTIQTIKTHNIKKLLMKFFYFQTVLFYLSYTINNMIQRIINRIIKIKNRISFQLTTRLLASGFRDRHNTVLTFSLLPPSHHLYHLPLSDPSRLCEFELS